MNYATVIPSYVALLAAAVAAVAMFARLGGKAAPFWLWLHRLSGYVFIVLITFLFVGMLATKGWEYGGDLSPRAVWHAAAAFATFALMLLKWAVVRPFRGLLKYAPPLGLALLVAAFVAINMGAAFALFE